MISATVSKSIEMDVGHRVPSHEGKCRSPHGHRYKVTAYVLGPVHTPTGKTDDGMVVDFGVIKDVLTQHVHDVFDHGFMIWRDDLELRALLEGVGFKLVITDFVPTAECLAQHVYKVVSHHIRPPMVLERIEVHETPTSVASYCGGTAR